MFVFNRDFRYVRIYIYVAVRQPICACSVVRNVGGVKCGPLSKHKQPIETSTKNVLNWICSLRLLFNIQSSDYGVTNVAKVSLYLPLRGPL